MTYNKIDNNNYKNIKLYIKMGRKVRETEHIVDQHIRRITMKKRRINLIKRAM